MMKSEMIISICERFRRYLITNNISKLLKEFDEYRTSWKLNEFFELVFEGLILMRKWVNLQEKAIINGTNILDPTTINIMRVSSHDLFIAIIDYFQSDVFSNRILSIPLEMWKEIILNRWTMNEKFYVYLGNKDIKLPCRSIDCLYDDLHEFYQVTINWSSSTKIALIEIGFTHFLNYDNLCFDEDQIIPSHVLFTLNDYHALAQRSQISPNDYKKKLISSMNTPEKMQIFFDFYPNVDVSELTADNQQFLCSDSSLTMLDRLLRMEPYYYETTERKTLSTVPNLTSDDLRFRSANTLKLFQHLICQGAKFSICLENNYFSDSRGSLFVTTLGFYILSLIRFRDHFIVDHNIISNIFGLKINPEIVNNAYKDEANNNYIEYLIKRASTFSDTFRSFFLIHLNSCCPFLHTKEFLQVACSTSNFNLRNLYNELIEQNRTLLTLKQRCRLLIKESLNIFPSDLESLTELPLTLRYYASFDLLNPNFPQITLNTLTKVGGRIVPNLFDKILFMEHLWEPTNSFTDSENETSEDSDDFYHYDSYYDDDDEDFMHFWDDDEDEDELEDDDLIDEDEVYAGTNEEDEWLSID